MFKKRPNFLNSSPTSTQGALRLPIAPSGRFWQQTAICPVSLWALFVELHPLNWARAQAVRRINPTNSLCSHGFEHSFHTESLGAFERSSSRFNYVKMLDQDISGGTRITFWINLLSQTIRCNLSSSWRDCDLCYEEKNLNTRKQYFPWQWADHEVTVSWPSAYALCQSSLALKLLYANSPVSTESHDFR